MNGYYSESNTSKKYNLSKRNSPCRQVNEQSFSLSLLERILTIIDKFTIVLKSKKVISIAKMIVGVICFMAFLGILGSLEIGTITGAFAITASLLLIFIELLCVIK